MINVPEKTVTICGDLHRLLLCVFLVRHGQGRGDVS